MGPSAAAGDTEAAAWQVSTARVTPDGHLVESIGLPHGKVCRLKWVASHYKGINGDSEILLLGCMDSSRSVCMSWIEAHHQLRSYWQSC